MKIVLQLINTHLLAALTLACILGITVSCFFLLAIHAILITAMIAAALLLLCCLQRAFTFGLIASLLLFFLCGLLLGTSSSREPDSPNHIFNLIEEPTDVVAVGRLVAMPAFDGTTSQAKIALQSVRRGISEPHIPAQGTVLLRLSSPWPTEYEPGSQLAIRALFQRPSRYIVPGVFDYPAYLAQQDIWITGFARSPAQLHRLTTAPNRFEHLHSAHERIRTAIGHFIDAHTRPHLAGLYRAILLGDRSRISYATLESFKASGTMHILAISGIHVTLIGTLLFTIIYWLLRRSEWLLLNCNLKKIAGLICLPLLIGYMLLAGGNTPVLRAGIMSAIIILAFCTDRSKTLSALIALGALLILIHSPQTLFTASFQLSFAAFTSIMMFMPILQRILLRETSPAAEKKSSPIAHIRQWVFAALLASSAAVLGTAPIVIYYFHRFPLAGPLANLVLEPLICLWALPLGFLALPCIIVCPLLATFLLYIGGIGLQLALHVAGIVQAIPQATLWLPPPGPILVTCYYCSFTYLLFSWTKSCGSAWRIISFLPFAICLFLLLVPAAHIFKGTADSAVIHILDVGQGCAALIQLDNGKTMLIDGGGSAFTEESVGQRIIAPFLWDTGITRLDTIVLTHPDSDHYNGMPFLINHFSPSHLWTNTLTGGSAHYRGMLNMAEKRGVKVMKAESGRVLHEGEMSVRCVVNTYNDAEKNAQRNDGLVIQVTIGNSRILFPGDIGSTTEKKLITEHAALESDILLAAHHGSVSSNSAEFLQYVDPKIIIASAGRSRNNLFPSESLRHYCKQQRLPLLVTAETGSMKIRNRGNTTEISVVENHSDQLLRRNNDNWLPAQVIMARKHEEVPTILP